MFALFYVILAPFLGAFADAVPKGKVMFMSNGIKVLDNEIAEIDVRGTRLWLVGLADLWTRPQWIDATIKSPGRWN